MSKRGRRPSAPGDRVWRRFKRAAVAEAIYQRVLPEAALPEPDEDDPLREKHKREQAGDLRRAVGNRELADEKAGELVHASASTVKHARRGTDGSRDRRKHLRFRFRHLPFQFRGEDDVHPTDGLRSPAEHMDAEKFKEFAALMRIRASGKVPRGD